MAAAFTVDNINVSSFIFFFLLLSVYDDHKYKDL